MSLTKKVGIVFIVLAGAALAELLSTVILGRHLPAEQFGKFKFFQTIVISFSTLLILGQNSAIIRVLGKDDFKQYDWRLYVRYCLAASGILGFCALSGLCYAYQLRDEFIYLFIAFASAVGIDLFSSIARARGQYNTSIIISKISSFFFLACVCVIIYVLPKNDMTIIAPLYAGVFLCSFLGGFFFVKNIESGPAQVPLKTIKEGLWLFLNMISFIILIQIDQFFIVKMLGYGQLAGYTAVISTTRGFEILSVAIWFVLMPHYTKNHSRSILGDTIKVSLGAGVLVLLYFMWGNDLLHFLFKGKFDDFTFLLNYLVLIGFIRVLYSIPSCVIDGRLTSHFLRLYLGWSLAGICINILGNLWLIPRWGLKGAAIATLSAWVFRVIAAYGIVYLNMKDEQNTVKSGV